jgi:nucleotide-binding universal stress UspA family protein
VPNLYANMTTAIHDFQRARRRAALRELIATITGKSLDLLPYEDVRKMIQARSQQEQGLQDIPLNAIIGSVGRYSDFTRGFLPRQDSDAQRWARIKVEALGLKGLPPIEVYKIGDAYFVKDGNHRVSVAREIEANHIQAYVTEVETTVHLTPDTELDDLILQVEYAEFLKWSNLKECFETDLLLTAPGKYDDLKEHIKVHRYYMGLEADRPISREEAVIHWYEEVYQPVVTLIRQMDLLRAFPDRTETDLYLWMAEHRAALRDALGWEIDPAAAAEDLAHAFSSQPDRVLSRVGEKLIDALTPDGLSPSPPTGTWRESRPGRYAESAGLFRNILVPIDGKPSGWRALAEALKIAQMESGRILGLHIVPTDDYSDTVATSERKVEFDRRCAEMDVPGDLALETGSIASEIAKRAKWADMIVAPLNYPPGADAIAKLKSGFHTMIVRSPCPVLALPGPLFPVKRILLAYDGSQKGREALFLAPYLVFRLESELVVVTTGADEVFVEQTLTEARDYLSDHDVEAEYLGPRESDVGEAIRKTADEQEIDLIVMGSYGRNALLEIVLGSAVNDVLRKSRRPVLICR